MPRYLVRALSDIEADTPNEAAEVYRAQLAEVPTSDWIVRVEEEGTRTMWYCDGVSVYSQEEFFALMEHLANQEARDDEDPE